MNKRGDKKQYYENILLAFSTPKTPRQVERELGIRKIKTKHFVDKGVLTLLNPRARKGRLYLQTEKLRVNYKFLDWDIMGWVISSPKQRFVVLKTIAIDSRKRISENIRKKSSGLNECLARISTKEVLKELIKKKLVKTEMGDDRRRYYWVSERGKKILSDIEGNIENYKYGEIY